MRDTSIYGNPFVCRSAFLPVRLWCLCLSPLLLSCVSSRAVPFSLSSLVSPLCSSFILCFLSFSPSMLPLFPLSLHRVSELQNHLIHSIFEQTISLPRGLSEIVLWPLKYFHFNVFIHVSRSLWSHIYILFEITKCLARQPLASYKRQPWPCLFA